MNKTLILLRGLPGSGKTTAARELLKMWTAHGARIVAACATDDYFMKDGVYTFDGARLKRNHEKNQARVDQFMLLKADVIIVDNTNIKLKDMEPYIELAKVNDYDIIQVIIGSEEMKKDLDNWVDLCYNRNVHGVPRENIERMARQFQWE